MHVHASDRKLTEVGSAKFFVKSDGSTVLNKQGDLTSHQINEIKKFIKENYVDMYIYWKNYGGGDYYNG
jgi:hypothetical protein